MLRQHFRQLLNADSISGGRLNVPSRRLRVETLENRQLLNVDYGLVDSNYQITDINQDGAPLFNEHAIYGNDVYYLDTDATFGAELRKLDLETGLASVVDINPGVADSFAGKFSGFALVGHKLYFSAFDATSTQELRWIDVTQEVPEVHTLEVPDYFADYAFDNSISLTAVGDKLYFPRYNKNPANTSMDRFSMFWIDTSLDTPQLNSVGSSSGFLRDADRLTDGWGVKAVGSILYFVADAGPSFENNVGTELQWIDTNYYFQGQQQVSGWDFTFGPQSSWSAPHAAELSSIGDKLYFYTPSIIGPILHWVDTSLMFSNFQDINADLGGHAQSDSTVYFFKPNQDVSGGTLSWIDEAATRPLVYQQVAVTSDDPLVGAGEYGGYTMVGTKMYFSANGDLYWIDTSSPTPKANRLVIPQGNGNVSKDDQYLGAGVGYFGGLTTVNDRLYFSAFDSVVGMELRWIDTTIDEPVAHTLDVNTVTSHLPYGLPGSSSYFSNSDPGKYGGLIVAGDRLLFTGKTLSSPAQSNITLNVQNDLSLDVDLYWIDTKVDAPTLHTAELIGGSDGSDMGLRAAYALVGSKLFFNAKDTDGSHVGWIDTTAATAVIHYIEVPPPSYSYAGYLSEKAPDLAVVGGKVYFNIEATGVFAWVDSEEEGMPIHTVDPSIYGVYPGFVVAESKLYFFAGSPDYNHLFWVEASLMIRGILLRLGEDAIDSDTFMSLVDGKLFVGGRDDNNKGSLQWIDTTLNTDDPEIHTLVTTEAILPTRPLVVGENLIFANTAANEQLYVVHPVGESYERVALPLFDAGREFGFKSVGDRVYFDARTSPGAPQKLYYLDATNLLAVPVEVSGDYDIGADTEDPLGPPKQLQLIGGNLYFDAVLQGDDPSRRVLILVDTTQADAVIQPIMNHYYDYTYTNVWTSAGNKLYFVAQDEHFGNEIRWMDVNDLFKAVHTVDISSGSASSFPTDTLPRNSVLANGKIYFQGDKLGMGTEFIVLDALTPAAEVDNYDVPINYLRDAYDATGTLTSYPEDNGVLANDSDTDGGALTAELITPPVHGTLTFNSDGTFRYKPASDAQAGQVESFTYRVTDSNNRSSVSIAYFLLQGSIASPFYNPTTHTDVLPGTSPGTTSSLDALAVINFLNAHRGRISIPVEELPQSLPPAFYYDVNNDFVISSLDILAIYNYLNIHSRGGEGESDTSVTTDSDRSNLANLFDAAIVDLSDLEKLKGR